MAAGESITDSPAFHSPTVRTEALEHQGAAEGLLGHNQRNEFHVKITHTSGYTLATLQRALIPGVLAF